MVLMRAVEGVVVFFLRQRLLFLALDALLLALRDLQFLGLVQGDAITAPNGLIELPADRFELRAGGGHLAAQLLPQ